ncbi:MAG: helix-turn-helix domain-containing protein [Burkholderia sp.]
MFTQHPGIDGTGDASMPTGRPKTKLALSEDERSQLTLIARSRSISAALVTRARIVLAAATGEPNSAIAERLQLTRATVGKWPRIRFLGSIASTGCMTKCLRASRARLAMSGWLN